MNLFLKYLLLRINSAVGHHNNTKMASKHLNYSEWHQNKYQSNVNTTITAYFAS